MNQFKLSEKAKKVVERYPNHITLLKWLIDLEKTEKSNFIRQWIAEGIPFVFKEYPLLFQEIRRWLSNYLDISECAINIIGSGKIGYSMSPSDFGRKFNHSSDLDFSIFSTDLFQRCVNDFKTWYDEYSTGYILPKNPNEERYWKDNYKNLPNNIERGFIDPYKVPSMKRYKSISSIRQSQWLIKAKLNKVSDFIGVRACSIRVYKDYFSFCRQLEININYMINQLT